LDAGGKQWFLYEGKWLLRTLGPLRLEGIPALEPLPCLVLALVALKDYNLGTRTFDVGKVSRGDLARGLFARLPEDKRTQNLSTHLNTLRNTFKEFAPLTPPISLDDGRTNKLLERKNVMTDVEIVVAACEAGDLETLKDFYRGKFLDGLDEGGHFDTGDIAELLSNIRSKLNELVWTCILDHEDDLDWSWVEKVYYLDPPQAADPKEEVEKLLRTNGKTVTPYTPPDLEDDDFSDLQEQAFREEISEQATREQNEVTASAPPDKQPEANEAKVEEVLEPDAEQVENTEVTGVSPETVSPETVSPNQESPETPRAKMFHESAEPHLEPPVTEQPIPRGLVFAFVGACALALVAFIWFLPSLLSFFPRGASSLELSARVTGFSFTLSEPHILTTAIAVSRLDVTEAATVQFPITTSANGEASGGENLAADAAGLAFTLSNARVPMLLFPDDLVLPAGSVVRLRVAAEKNAGYALEVSLPETAPAFTAEVAVSGETDVDLLGDSVGSEGRNFGLGKVLSFTPQTTLNVFFTPAETTVFVPDIEISDVSFMLREPSRAGQALPGDAYSGVLSGMLKLGAKEMTLQDGDELEAELLTGRLEQLTLGSNVIDLTLRGTAQRTTLDNKPLAP
jgi:hypothetical protein